MGCIPISHSVSCVRLSDCLNNQGGLYAESKGLQRGRGGHYGEYYETSGLTGFHRFPITFPNKCMFTTASARLKVMIQEDDAHPIRTTFAYSIDKASFICGYDLDTVTGPSTLKPIEVIAVGY